MKHQTLEHHFHTPGVGQTRFAAAIDILKNKSWCVAPRSSSPTYCAVCGKEIRLSPKKRERVVRLTGFVTFLPALILLCVGGIRRQPVLLFISIIVQAVNPILTKYMTMAASAFLSWEDETSFKRRLSKQLEEKGMPRYMKYLFVRNLAYSILTLLALLLECR